MFVHSTLAACTKAPDYQQTDYEKVWLYFADVLWITVIYFCEYFFRQRYSMFKKDKTIQNTFLLFSIHKTCNSLETALK